MKTTNKGIKEFIFEQKCIPWRVKNLFSREKILLSFCNEIIRDFSEFSGISIAKIYKYIKNFHQFTNKEWDSIPRNEYEKKATEFYSNSEYYIYDLLSANPSKKAIVDKLNKFNPLLLQLIIQHPGLSFLEFGGGLGVFCQIVTELGKEVTYLDIPGKVSEFALWRFKKFQIPVKVIISDPSSSSPMLGCDYDIIFSDGVLEHVNNPELIVLSLSIHLRDNGLLMLLVDLDDSGEYLMHRRVDINKLHKILKNSGLVNICGENTFCSIWKKTNKNV